jgi:hypothetical protein
MLSSIQLHVSTMSSSDWQTSKKIYIQLRTVHYTHTYVCVCVCTVNPVHNGKARERSFLPLQACSVSMATAECFPLKRSPRYAWVSFQTDSMYVKNCNESTSISPLFHIWSEGASGENNRTPQKLTGSELVKELPAFYGSRSLATLLTRATSWATWTHFTVSFYFFIIHLI